MRKRQCVPRMNTSGTCSALTESMNREDNQKFPNTKHNAPAKSDARMQPASTTAQNQGDGVGEGNRAAANRYNDGLAKSLATGDSDELAAKAKAAVDGPEGEELAKAEEIGKRGEPKVTSRR